MKRIALLLMLLSGAPGVLAAPTLKVFPDAITPDTEYSNFCLAAPADSARQLTAPLRGLGDGAVPMN